MKKKDPRAEAYYENAGQFKEGILELRQLALGTELEENYKWNGPVYTLGNKNVLAILEFKNHFGVWFYNGVYLKDRKKVLENAQQGKTKAMRHWKFQNVSEIDGKAMLTYMKEAVENQKKGKELKPARQKTTIEISPLIRQAIEKRPELKKLFQSYTPYKQREFIEYIDEAKREATKHTRLEKVLSLIQEGKGLNDRYR